MRSQDYCSFPTGDCVFSKSSTQKTHKSQKGQSMDDFTIEELEMLLDALMEVSFHQGTEDPKWEKRLELKRRLVKEIDNWRENEVRV